jgi:hypothetical protein
VSTEHYQNFTLSTFCNGYIIQGPLHQCEVLTSIKNFINHGNIDVVREQIASPKFSSFLKPQVSCNWRFLVNHALFEFLCR